MVLLVFPDTDVGWHLTIHHHSKAYIILYSFQNTYRHEVFLLWFYVFVFVFLYWSYTAFFPNEADS